MKYPISYPHTLTMNISASYKVLSMLEEGLNQFWRACGLGPDTQLKHDILLATHEIFINIVDHAYASQLPGRIIVSFKLCDQSNAVEVLLLDHGDSFDMAQVAEPDLSMPQEHGYGLFLAKQLMDDVIYTPRTYGNHWQLMKYLPLVFGHK